MDSLKFANLLLLLLLRLCKAEPHSLLGASSTRVKPDYRGFAQVSLRPGTGALRHQHTWLRWFDQPHRACLHIPEEESQMTTNGDILRLGFSSHGRIIGIVGDGSWFPMNMNK